MINLVFADYPFDFSKYNANTNTFTQENPQDPWTLEWLLYQCNIPFTRSTTLSNNNDYVLFNLAGPGVFDDFRNIPDQIWDYISQHNVKLILYHAVEGTSYFLYPKPWKNLEVILREKNVLPNQIFYITGDILAPQKYKHIKDDYFSKINVLGLDVFEMIHMHRHFKASGFNFLDSIEQYEKQKEKEKKFLNLNNIMRPHRQALLFYLQKYNLLHEGFVSSLTWRPGPMDNVYEEDFNSEFNFDNSQFTDFLTVNNNVLKLDSLGKQASETTLYSNSYYSLVTETHTSKDILFITEKTYKPILMGHPFMIIGNPNILSYLQRKGYFTFPELFDESYDNRLSTKDRLKIIINNLTRDVGFSDSVYAKLKHNQRLFLKQPSAHTNKYALIHFLVGKP